MNDEYSIITVASDRRQWNCVECSTCKAYHRTAPAARARRGGNTQCTLEVVCCPKRDLNGVKIGRQEVSSMSCSLRRGGVSVYQCNKKPEVSSIGAALSTILSRLRERASIPGVFAGVNVSEMGRWVWSYGTLHRTLPY